MKKSRKKAASPKKTTGKRVSVKAYTRRAPRRKKK